MFDELVVSPERVVRSDGPLDYESSTRFLTRVSREISRAYVDRSSGITLDLSRVDYLDSAGLRALADAKRHADDAGLRFQIHGAIPAVERVIELTGLSTFLGLESSR